MIQRFSAEFKVWRRGRGLGVGVRGARKLEPRGVEFVDSSCRLADGIGGRLLKFLSMGAMGITQH